jgi:hypothetical protein
LRRFFSWVNSYSQAGVLAGKCPALEWLIANRTHEKKINYENIKKSLFLQPAWFSKILPIFI